MAAQQPDSVDVAIIGAGPAGLTAAYLLTKAGKRVTVIEKDPVYVGGISRTVEHNGFRFDIGGHRFFSKSREVVDLWNEILPDDFIERPRMSRIYYEGKFYSYPLRAFEALWNLGVFRSSLCMASYLRWKLFPKKDTRSFEDWTINQFGKKLFSIFFKTYTEKVWGMPCNEISADWAAQRIKGLEPRQGGARRFQALAGAQQAPQRRHGNQDAAGKLPLSAPRPRHDVGGRARQGGRRRQCRAYGPCAQAAQPGWPGLARRCDRPRWRARDPR